MAIYSTGTNLHSIEEIKAIKLHRLTTGTIVFGITTTDGDNKMHTFDFFMDMPEEKVAEVLFALGQDILRRAMDLHKPF